MNLVDSRCGDCFYPLPVCRSASAASLIHSPAIRSCLVRLSGRTLGLQLAFFRLCSESTDVLV
jgi:hypothetical protein